MKDLNSIIHSRVARSVLCLALLGLASCSAGESATDLPPADGVAVADSSAASSAPLKIDVFSARGFLGGSEYERYYLTEKLLWRECGSVLSAARDTSERQPLEGDEVLSKDPQLKIQQRRVEKLTASQIGSLKEKALRLLESIDPNKKRLEPPPGSVFSLSSPGVFEMFVEIGGRRQRIISSVDAVADKQSDTLEKAHELFSLLRGVGPEICGAQTFYGITRRSL